jgi:putative oxidoreductase
MQVALIVVQLALALVFLLTGAQKLVGAKRSLANRDHLHIAPWFWRLTGIIELIAVALLVIGIWVHVLALAGAVLIAATMVGAFYANVRHHAKTSHTLSNIVLFALAVFVIVLTWPALTGMSL